MLGLIRIQEGHSSHIYPARTMRGGDSHGCFQIIYRNSHVSGKKVSSSNRDNAKSMCSAGHCAGNSTDGPVASTGNNHICPEGKSFLGTGVSIFIKLSINKNSVRNIMIRTVFFYV